MSSRDTLGIVLARRSCSSHCDGATRSSSSYQDPSTITPLNSSATQSSPSTTLTDSPSTPLPSTTPTLPASQPSTTASAQSASPSSVVNVTTSTPNAGTIAGTVIGGVIFLVLVLLGLLLYLRARKRKRTPPSSEFMNSLQDGAPPVLRLDSGLEYSPALPEKSGGYLHYPPVPLPFQQDPYHANPPMQDMKFPDEMTDMPSRPSIEKPLQPQRYSALPARQHQLSSSVGSRRELFGHDADAVSRRASPVPTGRDSVRRFAAGLSIDEPRPPYLSQSPTLLHPLRRQPSPEDT